MKLLQPGKFSSTGPAGDAAGPRPPLAPLEQAALVHAGGLLVFAAWAFDGNVGWARTFITLWGGAGVLLTLAAGLRGGWRRILRWLWPLLAFNLLVLAGCLNPSFSVHTLDGESLLVHTGGIGWLPGSADPAAALRALGLFDSVFLAGFNLMLLVQQRRTLRWLLIVATTSALALSIFGTVQKLTGAGLFFGLRESPNPFFFATFVYHNHWGAFAILSVATCAGLVFHYMNRPTSRDFWHSPSFICVVGLLFIAMTAPLSESRSSTLLVALLIAVVLIHALRNWGKKTSMTAASSAGLLGGALAAAAILAFAIYKLDEPGLKIRAELTRQQLGQMHSEGGLGSRAMLYRDTWHMARDNLWFGWGFDSYATVFRLYNTQKSADRLPVFYAQAHSDWLQSLAETGLAGTVLIGLLGALPLLTLRRHHFRNPLVLYPLLGCALVLLYAGIEFPFECPAVAVAFWINLFAAVRYARLSPAGNQSR
ncbi:MAG TPA: O-antigen ligase family protein [Opitutaceae bacterium]|jgi:O-antigen ligase|nr:O-antigen ligase family protein [Opitutaceae bacterium]